MYGAPGHIENKLFAKRSKAALEIIFDLIKVAISSKMKKGFYGLGGD